MHCCQNSQKWESLIRDGEDQPWNYPGALRGRGHGWGHLALVRARCGGGAHRRILKRKGKNTDTTQPPRSQAPRFALVNRLSYMRGIMLLRSNTLSYVALCHGHYHPASLGRCRCRCPTRRPNGCGRLEHGCVRLHAVQVCDWASQHGSVAFSIDASSIDSFGDDLSRTAATTCTLAG